MKTFHYSLSALLLFVAASMFSACRSDPTGPDASTAKTTIAGRVLDEQGDPVAGATVRGHGGTTTTDANGFFLLKDLAVPEKRCFVVCSASGYFNSVGAATPRLNGATPIEITLAEAVVAATVDSDAPETVILDDGGEIDLPADGFQLENGTRYDGEVEVLARQLYPDSEDFGRLFPGDILAQRSDGSEASLLSYGVIIAELRGTNGQQLKLASGKTARLTFPIPASMMASAPATMPLWYFDESLGKWKEEGSATRSGDVYQGSVAHFTPWNCDEPFNPCKLQLRLLTRSGKPAGGVKVRVGQVELTTDADGRISAWGTQATTAQVPPERNFGVGSEEIDVPCAPLQVTERTIVIDGATVSGLVIDCDGRPRQSLVYATWGTGQSNYVASPGIFNMLVPAGQRITVHAVGGSSREVGPLASGDSLDIGTLVICPGGRSGRPGPGSVYYFDMVEIDSNFAPIPGTQRVCSTHVFDSGLERDGKIDVTEYYDGCFPLDADPIAHEPNGDLAFQGYTTPYTGLWYTIPIASHNTVILPSRDTISLYSKDHWTGRVVYEGTEQIMVGSKSFTTDRFMIEFVETNNFNNGEGVHTETSRTYFWYASEIDFFARVRVTEISDYGDGYAFFSGSQYDLTSYELQ